jgi:hydroxypyruvate isomerase
MTERDPFALRYAPHISFYGRALFSKAVGSDDPVAQIEFVASQGFAGVQDPMAAGRPVDEQARIGAAIDRCNIQNGCFSFRLPGEDTRAIWSDASPENRARLSAGMNNTVEVAQRIGSRQVSITTPALPNVPRWLQLAHMADNLAHVADVAAAGGVTLLLEGTDSTRLPQMLMTGLVDSFLVARMAAHPAVGLIFDTGHIQAMNGNLIDNLDAVWDLVGAVQLADCPGRREPGAGEINFDRFLARLIGRSYRGLCELEHFWSRDGADAEMQGIDDLRALDRRAAALAEHP